MNHENSIKESVISQEDVYNGGDLRKIATEDLLDNPTAIDQLVNDYNAKIKEIKNLQDENRQLKSDLEYQKTTPYIALFSTLFNVCGTIVVGLGVSLISFEGNENVSVVLMVTGGFTVVFSSLMSVLYRWARGWFNKTKKVEGKNVKSHEFNNILTYKVIN